jgi:hypothetical protein
MIKVFIYLLKICTLSILYWITGVLNELTRALFMHIIILLHSKDDLKVAIYNCVRLNEYNNGHA